MQQSASRNQSLNPASWKQTLTEQKPREPSMWSASEMQTHTSRMKSQSRFAKASVMNAERVLEGEVESVRVSQTAQEPKLAQNEVHVSPKLFDVKKASGSMHHARKLSQGVRPVRAAEPMKGEVYCRKSAVEAPKRVYEQGKNRH